MTEIQNINKKKNYRREPNSSSRVQSYKDWDENLTRVTEQQVTVEQKVNLKTEE